MALAPRLDLSLRTDKVAEGEIIQSMAEFGWWRHVGKGEPTVLARTFAGDAFLGEMAVQGVDVAPPVYYATAAVLMRALGLRDLLVQLHAVRVLSALFGFLTIWAVWVGTRRLLGSVEAATGVAGVLAVHPQFVLPATAANPDSLVNLLAALIYWQFAAIATGRHVYLSFCGMLVSAVAATFTKRIGAPLLVLAGVAAIWLLGVTMRRGAWRLIASASLVALAVAASVLAVWNGGPEIVRLGRLWTTAANMRIQTDPLSLGFLWTFTVTLVRSSWLWFGWMAYPAPTSWMIVPWIVTVGGLAGAALALLRTRDATLRRGVIVAGLFLLIQFAAVAVIFFGRGRLAQGRYLFPAIGPWLVLVWIGVAQWWPARLRRWSGPVLVAAFGVLDFAGWWLYIVPTYAR